MLLMRDSIDLLHCVARVIFWVSVFCPEFALPVVMLISIALYWQLIDEKKSYNCDITLARFRLTHEVALFNPSPFHLDSDLSLAVIVPCVHSRLLWFCCCLGCAAWRRLCSSRSSRAALARRLLTTVRRSWHSWRAFASFLFRSTSAMRFWPWTRRRWVPSASAG